jgi:hypothetical protein
MNKFLSNSPDLPSQTVIVTDYKHLNTKVMHMCSINRLVKPLLMTLIVAFFVNVNSLYGQVIDFPRASLNLHFEQESGTNASSVTYNPTAQLYYSLIAGNEDYPLEVFNMDGINVYQTNAGRDMRGLWWNSKSNLLEGNCYGDGGIISFPLNDKSLPTIGAQILYAGGNHQIGENNCGVYDSKKKQTLYYRDGIVYKYKKGKQVGSLNLAVYNLENINSLSMIYTGVKSMEYGVLDFQNKKVYLFSSKTGKRTATITLPSDAVTHSHFRFSYANNYVFLYDVEKRSWVGFKIFN